MTCINMADILKGEIWTMLSDLWQDQSYAWNMNSDDEKRLWEMMRIDIMNECNFKIHSAEEEHESFHLNYFRGQLNHRIQKLLKVRESLRRQRSMTSES